VGSITDAVNYKKVLREFNEVSKCKKTPDLLSLGQMALKAREVFQVDDEMKLEKINRDSTKMLAKAFNQIC
jgi:hypothetical protein